MSYLFILCQTVMLASATLDSKAAMSQLEYIHSRRHDLSISDMIDIAFLRASLRSGDSVSSQGLLGDLRQYTASLEDILEAEAFMVHQISASLLEDTDVSLEAMLPDNVESPMDEYLSALSRLTSLALKGKISCRRLLVWTQAMQVKLSDILSTFPLEDTSTHKPRILLDVLETTDKSLLRKLLTKSQYQIAQSAVSHVGSRVTLAFSKQAIEEWLVRLSDVHETVTVTALKSTLRKLLTDELAYAGAAFDNHSLMDMQTQIAGISLFIDEGLRDPLTDAEEDAIIETISMWTVYSFRLKDQGGIPSEDLKSLSQLFFSKGVPLLIRQRERLSLEMFDVSSGAFVAAQATVTAAFTEIYPVDVAAVIHYTSLMAVLHHSSPTPDETMLHGVLTKAAEASRRLCQVATDALGPIHIINRVEAEMKFAISPPLMDEWINSLYKVRSSRQLDEKMIRHVVVLQEIIRTPDLILELQQGIHSLVDIEEKLKRASEFINTEHFSNKAEALAGNLAVWRAHLYRAKAPMYKLDVRGMIHAISTLIHHVVIHQRKTLNLPVLPQKTSDWPSIREYQTMLTAEESNAAYRWKYVTVQEVQLMEWRSEMSGYAAQFDGLPEIPADLLAEYQAWSTAVFRAETRASEGLVPDIDDLFKPTRSLQQMIQQKKRKAVLNGLMEKADASGMSYVVAGKETGVVLHVGTACPTAILKQLETQIEAFVSRDIIRAWVDKTRAAIQANTDEFQRQCGQHIIERVQSPEWYAEQKKRIYSIENLPRKLQSALSLLERRGKDTNLAMDAMLGNMFIWRAHLVRLESEGRLSEVDGGFKMLEGLTSGLVASIEEQLLIQREAIGLQDHRRKQSPKVEEAKMNALVSGWEGLMMIYRDQYDEDEAVLVILAANIAVLKQYSKSAQYIKEVEAIRRAKEIEISTKLLPSY